jgi:hypothetical protein
MVNPISLSIARSKYRWSESERGVTILTTICMTDCNNKALMNN